MTVPVSTMAMHNKQPVHAQKAFKPSCRADTQTAKVPHTVHSAIMKDETLAMRVGLLKPLPMAVNEPKLVQTAEHELKPESAVEAEPVKVVVEEKVAMAASAEPVREMVKEKEGSEKDGEETVGWRRVRGGGGGEREKGGGGGGEKERRRGREKERRGGRETERERGGGRKREKGGGEKESWREDQGEKERGKRQGRWARERERKKWGKGEDR